MINGTLIRGARGLLGWSAKELARRAHVGTATVQRIEHSTYRLYGQCRTVERIEHALIDGGVHFTEGADGEIGVQLNRQVAETHTKIRKARH
jgi:ribosome-binding protein aMBF1 (putative translation factor)